ncbi:DUF4054 domain-containing protein [uncultured Treponema sp.]|uniref:DUF4054 domain-containing protein n=1 Tax=uncultured Treponema sp. TaxID=162155 RepID=UPI0027D9C855|nr:DUF4054 domain-containing protein [uncultured Treponema sp.]
MTRNTFMFAGNFPTLTDDEINSAYEFVSVMFSGVLSLWGVLSAEIREKKRTLCMNLLVAWYLLDTKPQSASGVLGNGGMAVSAKSIGGTSLSFEGMDAQEGIKQLNSNVFGQKALIMIQGAPERFGIYA